MKILEIDINKLRPDKDQPRQSVGDSEISEMAQSITTEGVINPIEVDKDFVIITGECRWRAAKKAALKTVPVKVIDIGKKERFMRQVIENVHHNTMSDWDTANAFKKLLENNKEKDVDFSPSKKSMVVGESYHRVGTEKFGKTADRGYEWLSQKIGKSKSYISEKLAILSASEKFKESVRGGETPGTFIRVLQSAPEEYKKIVEKKILNDEFESRDAALNFVSALKREKDNPGNIKKILDTDYSKYKTSHEVAEILSKISPRTHELVRKSFEPSQDLSQIVNNLHKWIENNPKENVGKIHAARVMLNMTSAKGMIEKWLKGEKTLKIE